MLDGSEVRVWPTRLITARHHAVRALHRLHAAGCPPLASGTLHWPSTLVEAFRLLG